MVVEDTFTDIGSLLTMRPGFRDGRPYVTGTGVTVERIAVLATVDGLDAGQIAEELALRPEQVHAALAFYYTNRGAIDALLDQDEREFEAAAAEAR